MNMCFFFFLSLSPLDKFHIPSCTDRKSCGNHHNRDTEGTKKEYGYHKGHFNNSRIERGSLGPYCQCARKRVRCRRLFCNVEDISWSSKQLLQFKSMFTPVYVWQHNSWCVVGNSGIAAVPMRQPWHHTLITLFLFITWINGGCYPSLFNLYTVYCDNVCKWTF